jgi:hypothetical protein
MTTDVARQLRAQIPASTDPEWMEQMAKEAELRAAQRSAADASGAGASSLPVGSRGLGAARGFTREEHDFYPTDPAVSHVLLECERFDGAIWEPACGDGAMSRVLKRWSGGPVVSTDLVARGYGRGGVDFLRTKTLRAPNVVTNPPFKQWQPFARHALALGADKVALLGRLLLLEGWGRSVFFRETRLARVWVVGRAKMLPLGAADKGMSGMIAFAWFVWQRGHDGGITVDWMRPLRKVTALE